MALLKISAYLYYPNNLMGNILHVLATSSRIAYKWSPSFCLARNVNVRLMNSFVPWVTLYTNTNGFAPAVKACNAANTTSKQTRCSGTVRKLITPIFVLQFYSNSIFLFLLLHCYKMGLYADWSVGKCLYGILILNTIFVYTLSRLYSELSHIMLCII